MVELAGLARLQGLLDLLGGVHSKVCQWLLSQTISAWDLHFPPKIRNDSCFCRLPLSAVEYQHRGAWQSN
ncbi:hypothetical protein WJX77_005943 [Trebouxia sp. C0004]